MNTLVEREAEASALRATIDRALAGQGGAAVVLGPAGIGKSALLQTIADTPLRARGGELEQEFPYGVVRQLFEAAVRRLDPEAQATVLSGPARPVAALLLEGAAAHDGDAPSDGFALEHAFYWLTAHLSEHAPLVLVVDDLHWADLASLRVLLYLVRRLEGLPVAVVLASRHTTDTRRVVIDRIVAEAAVVLEPIPLTATGVGSLVHRTLETADEGFCDACHTASGGNPFLLSELIGAVEASGIEPIERNAGRIRAIGAQSVMRSVLMRLGGLSPEAAAVARTLAVVGESHPVDLIAELAEVPVRAAITASDALRGAHILENGEPPRFVHSIVRDAVYGDVAAAERSRLHRAAAASLAAAGASVDTVAGHLLLTSPGVDEWTFRQLVDATARPAAAAAPETVASYLDRALRETVPTVDRAPLLLALGAARFQVVGGDSVGPLSAARELATDPVVRFEATRALASAYVTEMRFAESWELIERSITEFSDEPDLAHDLEIYSAQLLYADLDLESLQVLLARASTWRPDPAGPSVRDRSMLAVQAWVSAGTPEPAVTTAEMARAALRTDTLVSDDLYYVSIDFAVWSLIAAGCYDEAHAHVTAAIEACLAEGRLLRAATLLPTRAEVRRRTGQLGLALDDSRVALELIPREQIYASQAAAVRVLALVERGDDTAARQTLAGFGFDTAVPQVDIGGIVWFARGRLRIAEGDLAGGVEDLLTYGSICERMQRHNPGILPWRSTAVGPLMQLGRVDEAIELAEAEYALAAITGVPEQRGRALMARGLSRGAAGLADLTEAAAVLESSHCQVDAALAHLTLGRVLHRDGKRDQAREHLRTASDIAARIGAVAIADEAQAALVASGARPRRVATTGVHALTPSETRVVSLAVRGLTNREIAHTLFVTPKTIETHLAGAYRKLGVTGKGGLAAALEAG